MPTSATGTSSNPGRLRRATRRASGFTLLEVLVVVVIIGIIASMAAVSTRVLGADHEMEEVFDAHLAQSATILVLRVDDEDSVIDTEHALHETGDVIIPLEKGWISPQQVIPFDQVVSGELQTTANENKVTFFKSVGMALFDMVTADLIYHKARQKGCGTEVRL